MEPFQFSLRARQDLAELYDYVAFESGADRADALRHKLDSALHLLAGTPGMGHWRDELPDASLRVWRVYRWLIVYRTGTNPLEIVRVLGGWRDLSERMRESEGE